MKQVPDNNSPAQNGDLTPLQAWVIVSAFGMIFSYLISAVGLHFVREYLYKHSSLPEFVNRSTCVSVLVLCILAMVLGLRGMSRKPPTVRTYCLWCGVMTLALGIFSLVILTMFLAKIV
jgi:hypothetical protein